MNPNRTYEENMAALKKVLTQRTYTALSHRNIEFVLKYQNASLQELAAYLRRRQAELRHIPGRTEIIGGDFIELRFRGWVNALEAIGVSRELAAKRSTPALEKTALFQAEFNTQRELDKAAKAEAKKQNTSTEKPQIRGKGRRNKNVRKTQEFKAEYQRQLTKFRQEQAAEKETKRAARQAEQQEATAEESAQ